MSINQNDSNRVGYKADISWYRERIASLQTNFTNPSMDSSKVKTADEYREILGDLYKKADKLDKRIDDESSNLSIPVDPVTAPNVSAAVKTLDPTSGGTSISYSLYKTLVEQLELGRQNLSVDDLITNSTLDPVSNSQMVQSKIYSSYASATPEEAPGDNSLQRYLNRYLNNLVSWNEHDYQVRQILNFADNYLGTFPDPAYIPWAMKKEMVFEKTHIDSFDDLWKNFSEIGKNESERFGGAFKTLTALKPDEKIADVTERYLKYTNDFLNATNDLLNVVWEPAVICCFIKYCTNLDMKTLKGFRALLQLLKMGFNLEINDILNSFIDIINNIMRGLLLNQLIGLITQIVQRLVDPIRRWLNNPNDPNIQKVFDCLPVRELIEKYIAEAIDYVQNFLNGYITEKYKELEIEHIYKQAKVKQAGENKWLTTAIKILDTVISSIELSAFCGINGTPAGEDIQRIMQQYGVGSDQINDNGTTIYLYPAETTPNTYNSFITPEQQEAMESGTLSTDTARLSSPVNQTTQASAKTNAAKECLKNIRPEDMPQVVRWITELNQKSQETI